jgi:hypothetical protein|tara:strand:- start:201 stop:737 length:537 start_codon:yes stop_codon:yes gene_type:complete
MLNEIMKIDKNIIVLGLIIFAVALRLVPHPPNFSPIGAIGLFSGCYFCLKKSWLIPIFALLISDFVLGFYNPISMMTVYMSFVISVIIGRTFLKNKQTPYRLGGAALVSATQFFILTNIGVWLSSILYQVNLTGLIECFVMAIPFYGNSLISELFYTFVLFGGYYISVQCLERKTSQV